MDLEARKRTLDPRGNSDLQMCLSVEFGIHWGAANGGEGAAEMEMNMEMEIR